MKLVKFNRPYSTINNTVIGVILLKLMTLGIPAVQAGPQSILDPYATVQPANEKVESRSFLKKKEAKKQSAKAPSHIVSRDAEANYPILPKKRAAKIETTDSGVNSASSINGASTKPGFLAGVKEIQHGYITTIKAAGLGIINGSKAAGAKVAGGTKGAFGGVNAASHKVNRAPQAVASANAGLDSQEEIADNSFPKRVSLKDLPGKPLDQVIEEQKRAKKVKDKPVLDEKPSKPTMLSSSLDKLNFFSKKKKIKIAPVTASNPNGMTR